MPEEAFRESIRGLLEKELGLKAELWTGFDGEGIVFGYPSKVEVDVALRDEEDILVEIKSHARRSDVYELVRKSKLYEKTMGKGPMGNAPQEKQCDDMSEDLQIIIPTILQTIVPTKSNIKLAIIQVNYEFGG